MLWLDTDATRTDGADTGRGRGMDAEDSGRQMLSFDIYLKVNVSRAVSFFELQASGAKGKNSECSRMWRSGEWASMVK